ncbi:hypothetical protein OUZ56_015700 [Daphnia magna]|uniref:Uncharacterized protein n=1 Tax=Daphnia magna TaxID=35525 RepID=A0ABR0ANH2_9CRUS|nr:hypothetical protein OUZ56_015700 [Daphnia magna]
MEHILAYLSCWELLQNIFRLMAVCWDCLGSLLVPTLQIGTSSATTSASLFLNFFDNLCRSQHFQLADVGRHRRYCPSPSPGILPKRTSTVETELEETWRMVQEQYHIFCVELVEVKVQRVLALKDLTSAPDTVFATINYHHFTNLLIVSTEPIMWKDFAFRVRGT